MKRLLITLLALALALLPMLPAAADTTGGVAGVGPAAETGSDAETGSAAEAGSAGETGYAGEAGYAGETGSAGEAGYASEVSTSTPLISWEGFTAYATGFKVTNYSGATGYLYIYVKNNTDHKMSLSFSDVKADGVAIVGTGVYSVEPHTTVGADGEEYCMLFAKSADKEAGNAALLSLRYLSAKLKLYDSDTIDTFSQIDVNIDVTKLSNLTPAPTSKPVPTPTPAPQYKTLSRGDKGDAVRRMQQKLIELGYLNDTADGSFGPKTAAAVRRFNEANGLGSSETAYASTQECMFSGLANRYTEPWIPVELTYLQWKNITADGAQYRVKISNTSKTNTIKGLEFSYYITDVWGNRLWGSMITRGFTLTETIKPGKEEYSVWFYMSPSWYTIDQVHMGISKIAFANGEVHEADNIEYWSFSLH